MQDKQQTANDELQTTIDVARVWQFDLLRCVACLCVILLHSTGCFVVSQAECQKNILGVLLRSISSIGVPLFVMISGYFLLSNPKNINCDYFYKKRLKRIGFPILFWSFFYLLFALLLQCRNGFAQIDWHSMVVWIYTGSPGKGIHLWYLYMILGLYILTPFMLTICKNYQIKLLLFLSSLLYLAYFIQSNYLIYKMGSYRTPLFIPLLSFGFIPYFIFGKYVGDKIMLNGNVSKMKHRFVCTASLAVFCVVSLLETWLCGKIDFNWSLCSLSPLVTLQAFSVYIFVLSFRKTPSKRVEKIITWTSSLTFGIYLFHIFFLASFSALFDRLGVENTVLSSAAKLCCVFLTSAVATAVFKKIPYLRECV